MNLVALIFAFAVSVALVSTTKADTKTVLCYWGSWSVYRWGEGELKANHINPHTCTHLVYAFAGLNERNQIYSLDPWNDLPSNEAGHKDNYRNLVALRGKNANLKVLLSIGGWNQGSSKFSKMVYYENSRNAFVSSVMNFLGRYNFDGLDIAWQWPNQRGGMSYDKASYVLLLQKLREEFKSKNYVLSIAAPAIYSESGYDLPQIMKYVDFVSVYAYDYIVNTHTLHHGSPLYNYDQYTSSVSNSIKYYLNHGAKADQLLLGVTLYARTYKLQNPQHTNVGDASAGGGDQGPFTQETGLLAWFELCSKLKHEGFTEINNSTDKTTYAFNNFEWVSYESKFSLLEKVAYAKQNNLAGLTVWSMDNDDNHNICGDSLSSAISKAL